MPARITGIRDTLMHEKDRGSGKFAPAPNPTKEATPGMPPHTPRKGG